MTMCAKHDWTINQWICGLKTDIFVLFSPSAKYPHSCTGLASKLWNQVKSEEVGFCRRRNKWTGHDDARKTWLNHKSVDLWVNNRYFRTFFAFGKLPTLVHRPCLNALKWSKKCGSGLLKKAEWNKYGHWIAPLKCQKDQNYVTNK
jgi:hypothetical protein